MHDDNYRTHEALRLAIGFGYLGFGAPVRLSDHDRDLHDPTGVRALIDRALDGAWHATGRRVVRDASPSRREVVPADWWEFLILDVTTDSAASDEVKFVGLRWHRGAPTPPAKQTAHSEGICRKWLTELMATSDKTKNKDQYRAEAKELYRGKLSDKAFKRAWEQAVGSEHTRGSWKKAGPVSQSS